MGVKYLELIFIRVKADSWTRWKTEEKKKNVQPIFLAVDTRFRL